jgi:hypothetical protein
LSCPLCNTIVKAIATLAAALGCCFFIQKMTRCSNLPATLADLLSKGPVQEFWDCVRAGGVPLPVGPAAIPSELLRWIHNPIPDGQLGAWLVGQLGLAP